MPCGTRTRNRAGNVADASVTYDARALRPMSAIAPAAPLVWRSRCASAEAARPDQWSRPPSTASIASSDAAFACKPCPRPSTTTASAPCSRWKIATSHRRRPRRPSRPTRPRPAVASGSGFEARPARRRATHRPHLRPRIDVEVVGETPDGAEPRAGTAGRRVPVCQALLDIADARSAVDGEQLDLARDADSRAANQDLAAARVLDQIGGELSGDEARPICVLFSEAGARPRPSPQIAPLTAGSTPPGRDDARRSLPSRDHDASAGPWRRADREIVRQPLRAR